MGHAKFVVSHAKLDLKTGEVHDGLDLLLRALPGDGPRRKARARARRHGSSVNDLVEQGDDVTRHGPGGGAAHAPLDALEYRRLHVDDLSRGVTPVTRVDECYGVNQAVLAIILGRDEEARDGHELVYRHVGEGLLGPT